MGYWIKDDNDNDSSEDDGEDESKDDLTPTAESK